MRILLKWTASFCALSIYALFCSPSAWAQKEELSALSGWVEWSDATSRLQRHLNSLAFQLLEKRQAAIRNLKSAEDWRTRIAETAKTLDAVVGPFPEKTPLNATVLGTVSKEGYTIEKVVFESIGPQDAEQNFNAGLLHGIDHADLLEVRAPRPTLLVATTRDFFSIQGARETFAEASGAFRMLGAGDRLGMIEDDFEHGYTPKTREAIYSLQFAISSILSFAFESPETLRFSQGGLSWSYSC